MKVIKINYTILYPEMSFEMVFLGFLDLKTVLPATKTLAPKSNNLFELSSVTPPSISINALDPESIIRFLSSVTLLKVFSINFCPPNPVSYTHLRAHET